MGNIVEEHFMSREVSGIELLAAAIGWYESNGAVPMPNKGILDGTRVNLSMFHMDDVYDLEDLSSDDNHGIASVPGNLIPFLAGISLGFDSITLATIIKEHSIDLEQINDPHFQDAGETIIQLYEQERITASPTQINIEFFKAFAADPELCEILHDKVSNDPGSMECIGLMHTDESDLWPVARIEEHARLIMTPTKRVVKSVFVSFDFVSSRPERIAELPNQSPIDFLKRSGMLSEAVLRKQTGFFSFWEDLLYVATNDQPFQADVLKAFTQVTDKETVDLLIRGLLSTTSETFESTIDAELVHSLLSEIFANAPAFSPVLNSVIFKLNLLPLQDELDETETFEEGDFYDELVNNQQTLVSRVAKELLARPAEHLGYGDYAVLTKLTNMNLPAQVIDFEPERLVNHILDSIKSFKTPNEVTCEAKQGVDGSAMHSLAVMAKLLTRDHEFDFSQFNHHDDDSKVALIKAGFNIDLKSLGRKGRGQVLEDGMGL
jgi:hypothetical protein